jgi:hypothetical protein
MTAILPFPHSQRAPTPDNPDALRRIADSWVRSFYHWGELLRTSRDPALRAEVLAYMAGARAAVARLRRKAGQMERVA